MPSRYDLHVQCFVKRRTNAIFTDSNNPSLLYISHVRPSTNSHPRILHSHGHHVELLLITTGTSEFLIHNRKYPVAPGDLVIYNSGIVHDDLTGPDTEIGYYCIAVGDLHMPDLRENALISDDAGYAVFQNSSGQLELRVPPPVASVTSGGTTTDKVFDLVRDLRRDVKIPMVFMTYANVVFGYGAEKFISTCAAIGIDGLILPDLPFEEKDEFLPICKRHGVDLISMIAPTSENRIAMIAKEAEGFLYIVSSLGVTGTRSKIVTDLAPIIKVVRENTNVPCAIGFGISTPEQAKEMSHLADGVIIGSAIIKLLERHGTAAPKFIGEYTKTISDAIA